MWGERELLSIPAGTQNVKCPVSVLVPCSGQGNFRLHDGECCWQCVLEVSFLLHWI